MESLNGSIDKFKNYIKESSLETLAEHLNDHPEDQKKITRLAKQCIVQADKGEVDSEICTKLWLLIPSDYSPVVEKLKDVVEKASLLQQDLELASQGVVHAWNSQDYARFKQLADMGIPLDDIVIEEGKNILHLASQQGNVRLVDELVHQAGMSIVKTEPFQLQTPLHQLCESRNYIEALSLLQEKISDTLSQIKFTLQYDLPELALITMRAEKGFRNDAKEDVQELKKIFDNSPYLSWGIVNLFLDQGLLPEASPDILLGACRAQKWDIVEKFLDLGVIAESRDVHDSSLLYAIKADQLNLARKMIEMGADSFNQNYKEESPIALAMYNGNWDVVEYMLEKAGIDSSKNPNEIAKAFLGRGFDIDAQDKNGDTLLINALCTGCPKDALQLILYGANVLAKSKEGKLPLTWACDRSHPEVAEAILDIMADNGVISSQELARAKSMAKRPVVDLLMILDLKNIDHNGILASMDLKDGLETGMFIMTTRQILSLHAKELVDQYPSSTHDIYCDCKSNDILLFIPKDVGAADQPENLRLKSFGFSDDVLKIDGPAFEDWLRSKKLTEALIPTRSSIDEVLSFFIVPELEPRRRIAFIGHGMRGDSLAGLSIEDYQKALFSISKLNPEQIWVSSCCAGGELAQSQYGQLSSTSQKVPVKCPIVIISVGDAIAKGMTYWGDLFRTMEPLLFQDKGLTRKEFQTVFQLSHFFDDSLENLRQVLLPRSAGIPAGVRLVDEAQNIDVISPFSLRQARFKNKEQGILKLGDSRMLALYSLYIPESIEIKLRGSRPPVLISQIGGNAYHYFEKLSFPDRDFEVLEKSFAEAGKLEMTSEKGYFIKQLHLMNKVWENVLIRHGAQGCEIFYPEEGEYGHLKLEKGFWNLNRISPFIYFDKVYDTLKKTIPTDEAVEAATSGMETKFKAQALIESQFLDRKHPEHSKYIHVFDFLYHKSPWSLGVQKELDLLSPQERASVIYSLIGRKGEDVQKAIDYLLQHSFAIDFSNERTLLMEAAYWGDLKVVTALLDLGADVKAKDSKGMQVLSAALHSGNKKILKKLVQAGAEINPLFHLPLIAAAAYGDREAVELLLKNGAFIDQADTEEPFKDLRPLHAAAAYGNLEVVKFLKEQGADGEIPVSYYEGEYTAAEIAAIHGYQEIVDYLHPSFG